MMAMATRAGWYVLRSRELFLFFLALPLLFFCSDSSLFAAEGTAHLTFQKAVLSKDNQKIYTIKKGDAIARIVRKMGWEDPSYRVIRQLNPHIKDLNRIYPGQQLILTSPEESGDAQEVTHYTAKAGDSITRIIIAELHAKSAEAVQLLRSIKRLNPEIPNLNKISAGQVIKIPRGKSSSAATAKNGADEKASTTKPLATAKYLPAIRSVIEQLNGKVITSGNHYIPLPEAGQVIVDCALVPIIELGEGTTIMLDHAGRMPDVLANIIQTNWQNYHLVRIAEAQPLASVLQEILRFSPSWQMVKAEAPLSFDDTPQVTVRLDWLITRKLPVNGAFSKLGLIIAADKSQLLPSASIAKYALKKGIAICEILEDKVQTAIPAPADISPLQQIKGANNDELLANFLAYLGLNPLPGREVKVFESRKDGFDLAVKVEYLVKTGGKTLLVTKNKLPQQFSEKLKLEGMTSFSPTPGATKIAMLKAILTALDIPSQFAFFSLPPPEEIARVHVSFPALQVARDKGSLYLIDYGMDGEIYEFMTGHWKLNMIGY
jgi:hypothetical protein